MTRVKVILTILTVLSIAFSILPDIKAQQTETTSQPQQRMKATEQQVDQIKTCLKAAYKVRTEAKSLEQASADPHFRNFVAQMVEELQRLTQRAQNEHKKFVESLSPDYLKQLQQHIAGIDEISARMNVNLQKMEQEAIKSDPDRDRIVQLSLDLARGMEDWQRLYRNIGSDMGVKFEAGRV
ncbi:MAG: hypothetical protein AB1756_04045 [Acidobacteriota bacterium]